LQVFLRATRPAAPAVLRYTDSIGPPLRPRSAPEIGLSATKDISALLAAVPKGSWAALSNDEERVVAYAADLQDALKLAHEKGEADPVVIRVPDAGNVSLLL
jgi:hypothetical protein